eukprot:08874.XXX_413507_413644_1 [CDS] Oithona nana genome sequencing.
MVEVDQRKHFCFYDDVNILLLGLVQTHLLQNCQSFFLNLCSKRKV